MSYKIKITIKMMKSPILLAIYYLQRQHTKASDFIKNDPFNAYYGDT